MPSASDTEEVTARPPRMSTPGTQTGTDLPASGSSAPPGWAVFVAIVLALVVAAAAIGIPVAIVRSRDDRRAEAQTGPGGRRRSIRR